MDLFLLNDISTKISNKNYSDFKKENILINNKKTIIYNYKEKPFKNYNILVIDDKILLATDEELKNITNLEDFIITIYNSNKIINDFNEKNSTKNSVSIIFNILSILSTILFIGLSFSTILSGGIELTIFSKLNLFLVASLASIMVYVFSKNISYSTNIIAAMYTYDDLLKNDTLLNLNDLTTSYKQYIIKKIKEVMNYYKNSPIAISLFIEKELPLIKNIVLTSNSIKKDIDSLVFFFYVN